MERRSLTGMKAILGAEPRGAGMGFRRGQRGQALLLAILVLFAVAATAALFTAIVGSQVAQVARESDLVKLRNIAQAGLNYANEQLTYGIHGADWRPPLDSRNRPYRFRCGAGVFTLSVDYGPDPTKLQSRYVRIVSTATLPDNPFLKQTVLALKPVLLTDYARFITDRFSTGKTAALGAPGLEMGGALRNDYVFTIYGPLRSNTDTIWYGRSRVDLFSSDAPAEGTQTWRDFGILRDDRIEIAGKLRPADLGQNSTDMLTLDIDGQQRAANLFWPTGNPDVPGTEAYDYLEGFPDRDPKKQKFIENYRRVLADLSELNIGPNILAPEYRAVPRVQPPSLDVVNPDTQVNRFLALTRDSGTWVKSGNAWYNTGAFGWGWTNFGGIYIDNRSDIQYDHDLEALRRDWVGSVGVHAGVGDNRADPEGPPTGPADWWDKTGHYYAPPGVEIVVHGDVSCPYLEIIRDDAHGTSTDPYYWRDPEGNAITVSAGDYTYQPTAGACAPLAPGGGGGWGVSGPRAIFPFPANGVVYAEGNVRIRGILPPKRGLASGQPEGYFGQDYGENGRSRRFDLVVVSGGTIYIEGDLLGPRSAGLIQDSLEGDMLLGTRIALLARDYVCVNTTALNPRPRRMFEAESEDSTVYWYNDRYPVYPPGGYPKMDFFQGPTDETLNSPAGAIAWDGQPIPTDPAGMEFVYHNVRLASISQHPLSHTDAFLNTVSDLRLMMGHSGWYAVGGTSDPAVPAGPTTGSDEPAVQTTVDIGPRDPATGDAAAYAPYPWGHATNLYTFLRPDNPALDPANNDESGHWYHQKNPADPNDKNDYMEFLANGYQGMALYQPGGSPAVEYLTGDDLLRVQSFVMPVRHYDEHGVVDDWEIQPQELGYVLGPMAVAPPRGEDPLPVQIEALVYAQNGSWFVIPGPWFNEDPDEDDYTQAHPGYHEPLNIRLTFVGAITENLPASMGDVGDWTSKWAGMAGATGPYLSYQYDPLLRYSEVWGGSYLRFRNLPLSPDLTIWGERISGQAGR